MDLNTNLPNSTWNMKYDYDTQMVKVSLNTEKMIRNMSRLFLDMEEKIYRDAVISVLESQGYVITKPDWMEVSE